MWKGETNGRHHTSLFVTDNRESREEMLLKFRKESPVINGQTKKLISNSFRNVKIDFRILHKISKPCEEEQKSVSFLI